MASATSDGHSGGRACIAFRPSSVSLMPRRKQVADQHEHDAADERDAPAPGIDLIGRHRVVDEIRRADPRMNPSVVPAAVELLTRPRSNGDEASVV